MTGIGVELQCFREDVITPMVKVPKTFKLKFSQLCRTFWRAVYKWDARKCNWSERISVLSWKQLFPVSSHGNHDVVSQWRVYPRINFLLFQGLILKLLFIRKFQAILQCSYSYSYFCVINFLFYLTTHLPIRYVQYIVLGENSRFLFKHVFNSVQTEYYYNISSWVLFCRKINLKNWNIKSYILVQRWQLVTTLNFAIQLDIWRIILQGRPAVV